MKITGHPTNPRYPGNNTLESACRQCDWVGPQRDNWNDARADGDEHTRRESLSVVSGLAGRNTQ